MTTLLRNARRRRRAQGDRGAALVEVALITPVFALLLFGIIEFGLTFRDYLTVANASRDGARAASALGDDTYADYNTLQVIRQATKGFRPNEIQRVIIFNAGSVGGSVLNTSHPAHACLNATVGITNVCNVYDAADLQLPKSSFGCKTGQSLDRYWCPSALNGQDGREVRASIGPDYVGVYVQSRHDFITGMFGPGLNLEDELVMRIEPQEL
ncbi:MAG TPA: pilus assembly protein [Acidimicrobiales bacterium]|nr:pilus assembly protein [Acidimicrobiales bacterium]